VSLERNNSHDFQSRHCGKLRSSEMSERVAILTGGEVPGMNLCIKSLVYRLIDLGFEPIGVRKGWEGLINYNHRDRSTYGANQEHGAAY
jgi:6-phosphofructokinase